MVDVSGAFKSATEGVTTKVDIQLVKNMVKGYIDDPRIVMLAVVTFSINLVAEEILELAAEANIYGDRALGVLTKQDLVGRGAECGVVDLVRAMPACEASLAYHSQFRSIGAPGHEYRSWWSRRSLLSLFYTVKQ